MASVPTDGPLLPSAAATPTAAAVAAAVASASDAVTPGTGSLLLLCRLLQLLLLSICYAKGANMTPVIV